MSDGTVPPSQALGLLDSLEQGRFVKAVDDSLEEIIAKLHEHQKNAGGSAKGKLVITLNMAHDGSLVLIAPQCTLTVPKPIRGVTAFYRTDDNGLSTEHPKQLNLPLVDATDTPANRGPMRIAQ